MSALDRGAAALGKLADYEGLASHVIEETLARMAPEVGKLSRGVEPASAAEFLKRMGNGGLTLNSPTSDLAAFTARGDSGLAMHTLVAKSGEQLSISPTHDLGVRANVFGLSMLPDRRVIGTNFPGSEVHDPIMAKLHQYGIDMGTSKQSVVSYYRPDYVRYMPSVKSPVDALRLNTSSAFHGVEGSGLTGNRARELGFYGYRSWQLHRGTEIELKGMAWPTGAPEKVTVTI
jgi:hypothetical protein